MIDVIMATRNGTGTLERTLGSFAELNSPPGGWRLIVVDNGSDDGTSTVLDEFAARLPMSVLFEPRPGKNRALNAALPFIEGGVIVFTDDDIVAPVNWLMAYNELSLEHPDVSVFGGRVAPLWPCDPPAGLLTAIPLSAAFAVHPPELEDGPVDPGMIWGANMAIRRAVLDAGFTFNELVGPAPGNYVMGSETELTRRLDQVGHRNWFSNRIEVGHQIGREQLMRGWLKARARRFGKALLRAEKLQNRESAVSINGLARWRVRQLLSSYAEMMWGRIIRDEEKEYRGLWDANVQWGALSGSRNS